MPAVGGKLIPVNPDILAGAGGQFRRVLGGTGGALARPALLRKLDRLDRGHRR